MSRYSNENIEDPNKRCKEILMNNQHKIIRARKLKTGRRIAALIAILIFASKGAYDYGLVDDFKSKYEQQEALKNASKANNNYNDESTSSDTESSSYETANASETIAEEPVVEEKHEVIDTSLYDEGYQFDSKITPEYLKSLTSDYSSETAWITIPNTNINYVVVHPDMDSTKFEDKSIIESYSTGSDTETEKITTAENYCLHNDFNGNKSTDGSIFIAPDNEDVDQPFANISDNTIIYGHNMKSGAMFGKLSNWKSDDYGEANKQGIIYTDDGYGYEIEFIAGRTISGYDRSLLDIGNFDSQEDKETFVNDFITDAKNQGRFVNDDYEFNQDDKFVTLVTCSYETNNERFVLLGKIHKIKVRDNQNNLNGYYIEENLENSSVRSR